MTNEMATIFLAHAERSILDGENDLVILRHIDGVELLPVTMTTPIHILDAA